MNGQELHRLRRERWRMDAGVPAAGGENDGASERTPLTTESAQSFVHAVGFCAVYPIRGLMLPTLAGLAIGDMTALGVHTAQIEKNPDDVTRAHVHNVAARLLRNKDAFEVPFAAGALLASADDFPFFYALVGERSPKQPPMTGTHGEKSLLRHAWELIEQRGPITAADLHVRLGKGVSLAAVERCLDEMRVKLRIVRVPAEPMTHGEAEFDVLHRWAPELLRIGVEVSFAQALSALLSRYLESVVAADEADVLSVLGHFAPRSRITDTLRMMLAAREFEQVSIEGNTMLMLTSREKPEFTPRVLLPKAEYLRQKAEAARDMRIAEKHESGPGHRGERPSAPREERKREFPKREFRGGERPAGRKEWKPREGASAEGRKEWKPRGDRKDFKPREGASAEGRKDWKPRTDKKDWKPRGDRKDFKPREGASAEGRKEWKPRTDKKDWKPRGDRKDFKPRTERKEWKPREGVDASRGERLRFGEKRGGEGQSGERKFGAKKFGAKSFGDKKFSPKKFGDKKFGPKKFGDRPPGGKSFGPKRTEDGTFGKPSGGTFGRPSGGGKFGKPGGKFGKPGGKFGRPSGGKFGKPGGGKFGKTSGGKFGKRSGGGPGAPGRSDSSKGPRT